jgi:hypothetical protein
MATKKKRKKQQPEAYRPEFEFELNFDDITMVESDGLYSKVKELCEDTFPYSPKWTIKSRLTIMSSLGEGQFILDFSDTQNVYIVQYLGSGDVFYNPDISCLSRWCQASGWKVPQPIEAIVRDNTAFWKHMWEVLLIDSPYLDEKYGLRKSLDMRLQQDMTGRMEGPDDEETL